MNELHIYFKKIHNQLDASFNKVLRSYELTCTQFELLAYLNDSSCKHTLTDISTHFGVKHTSVIHVLKILEKKGMIIKNKSSDARSKTITLTDYGLTILADVANKKPLVNKIVFAGLSEDELQLLKKMLGQIYANLESDEFQNL